MNDRWQTDWVKPHHRVPRLKRIDWAMVIVAVAIVSIFTALIINKAAPTLKFIIERSCGI